MINFTQIFQDSWHFIQNQKRTVLFLFAAQFIGSLAPGLLGSVILTSDPISETPSNIFTQINRSNFLIFFLLREGLFLFISSWSLMVIHHISQQSFRSYQQSAVQTSKIFLGTLVLNILISLPILVSTYLAFITVIAAIPGGQPSGFGAFSTLLLMIVGIVIYVRLNLAPLHYLVRPQKLTTSLREIWQQGKGRGITLLIYSLLIYVVAPMINQQLNALNSNFIFNVITLVISSAIHIFLLVFTYRFYTLFIQKA